MDHDRRDNTHVPYIKAQVDRYKTYDSTKLTKAAKKLRQWLIDEGMTVTALGRETGFNGTTLRSIISGHDFSYPTLAQAFAIEWATKGAVQAWEWLENPKIERQIRKTNLSHITQFEGSIKSFVLKYNSLKTADGMLRHKARMLSRMFGVEWGEVKRRAWEDAKERSKPDRADEVVARLMFEETDEEITDEEANTPA